MNPKAFRAKKQIKFEAIHVSEMGDVGYFRLPSSFLIRFYRDKAIKKKRGAPPHAFIYRELKSRLLSVLSIHGIHSAKVWLKEFVVIDGTITYGVFFSHSEPKKVIDSRDIVNHTLKTFDLSGRARGRLRASNGMGVDLIPYYRIDSLYSEDIQFEHTFKNYRNRIPSILDYTAQKMSGDCYEHMTINEKLFSGRYFANNTPFILLKIIEES